MRVVLHIDRLVLRGFSPDERERVAADLRAELGRLLADPAAAGRLSALPNAAVVRVRPERTHPQEAPVNGGIAAARSISRGLVR